MRGAFLFGLRIKERTPNRHFNQFNKTWSHAPSGGAGGKGGSGPPHTRTGTSPTWPSTCPSPEFIRPTSAGPSSSRPWSAGRTDVLPAGDAPGSQRVRHRGPFIQRPATTRCEWCPSMSEATALPAATIGLRAAGSLPSPASSLPVVSAPGLGGRAIWLAPCAAG